MITLHLFVSYSQLAVFDPALERPLNDWTPAHVRQGFSWRPGSVSFKALTDAGEHDVEVFIGEMETSVSELATRAIEVPFYVPASGVVEIGSISEGRRLEVPPGEFALIFEAFSGNKIRLTFNVSKDAKFSVLRADPDLAPQLPYITTADPA